MRSTAGAGWLCIRASRIDEGRFYDRALRNDDVPGCGEGVYLERVHNRRDWEEGSGVIYGRSEGDRRIDLLGLHAEAKKPGCSCQCGSVRAEEQG